MRTPGQEGWGGRGGEGNSRLPGTWRRCESVRFRSAGRVGPDCRGGWTLVPKPGGLGSLGTAPTAGAAKVMGWGWGSALGVAAGASSGAGDLTLNAAQRQTRCALAGLPPAPAPA